MRVHIIYQSGFEKTFKNVISMSTVTKCEDGRPSYEISIFNRSSEHIACHDIKSFDIYHAEFEWEHCKGGMRCPVCNRVVRLRFDRRDPLAYCPYCGNINK